MEKRKKTSYPTPGNSPRGLDEVDAYKGLAAAVLTSALKDMYDKSEAKSFWAIWWLIESKGALIMSESLGLGEPLSWFTKGKLLRPGVLKILQH